jgi:pimeloyl-ACP methyl ester carboxylesterase
MSLANWMTALEETREREEFVLIDGARMRCFVSGKGPALLLLHGLLGTADSWGAATHRLAESSSVYAPDALGMGGSDRVPGLDTSLTATVARLIEFMDAKGIETADIVGTSHGGAVALMLASLFPDRVRSLILHAPANPFSDIADPLIRFYRTPLGRWFAHRLPTLPASAQSVALGRMYGDARRIRSGSLERYVASLRVPGTVAYVLSILDRWEHDMAALEAALPGVRRVPALLLWGDCDRAVSLQSGERLIEYFDRAAFVVIPGAGHLPHEEVPVAFAGAINSFLAGLRRDGVRPIHSRAPSVVSCNDAA